MCARRRGEGGEWVGVGGSEWKKNETNRRTWEREGGKEKRNGVGVCMYEQMLARPGTVPEQTVGVEGHEKNI